MKKLNCDIIQDLLPSYVDGICSEATKEYVEEHVRECKNCEKLIEAYINTEISSDSIEQRQIDGFKKLHSRMKIMNLFSGSLVLLLIGLGIYAFKINYFSMSIINYYILFPVCLIGLYLAAGKKESLKHAEKKDYLVTALTIIDIGGAIGFLLYAVNCVLSGRKAFSVENEQLGPFIHNVWGIQFLLLIIGFMYLMIRMLQKNINNKWMLCLQMTGMFLLLAYVALLKQLTNAENFYVLFTQTTIVIGAMGLCGIILFAVLGRRVKRE